MSRENQMENLKGLWKNSDLSIKTGFARMCGHLLVCILRTDRSIYFFPFWTPQMWGMQAVGDE